MTMHEKVNTEQAFRDKYAERVKNATLETLPQLISDMVTERHDYGTICLAIGMSAAATAWAVERSPQGGITGFQAGAVAWEFLRHWGSFYPGECGGRMQDFDHLLYPQYGHRFLSIPTHAWEKVQEKAKANLEDIEHAHPAVVEHWRSIAAGTVPFGLTVEG